MESSEVAVLGGLPLVVDVRQHGAGQSDGGGFVGERCPRRVFGA